MCDTDIILIMYSHWRRHHFLLLTELRISAQRGNSIVYKIPFLDRINPIARNTQQHAFPLDSLWNCFGYEDLSGKICCALYALLLIALLPNNSTKIQRKFCKTFNINIQVSSVNLNQRKDFEIPVKNNNACCLNYLSEHQRVLNKQEIKEICNGK